MNKFETAYSCFKFVTDTEERCANYDPIRDALTHFEDKPFTVREVGEYIMGDAYHQLDDAYEDIRTPKARDLTAHITALLQAMKKHGKVKSWQEKDCTRPRTIEDEELFYDVNGTAFPLKVEVAAPNDSKVWVPTSVVFPKAVLSSRMVTKTVYSKVTYYQMV